MQENQGYLNLTDFVFQINRVTVCNFYCREEVERQQKEAHYRKMHEKGLTDEARRDLARLAIIKKQREEAAQKRMLEKKGTAKKH